MLTVLLCHVNVYLGRESTSTQILHSTCSDWLTRIWFSFTNFQWMPVWLALEKSQSNQDTVPTPEKLTRVCKEKPMLGPLTWARLNLFIIICKPTSLQTHAMPLEFRLLSQFLLFYWLLFKYSGIFWLAWIDFYNRKNTWLSVNVLKTSIGT